MVVCVKDERESSFNNGFGPETRYRVSGTSHDVCLTLRLDHPDIDQIPKPKMGV